jgi:hypothetical protein
MSQRLKIGYKIRKFENGKEIDRKYVRKFNEAMPLINMSKTSSK